MKIQTTNTILYCRNWQKTVEFYFTGLQLRKTVDLDWFVEFSLNDNSCLSVADVSRSSQQSCQGRGLTLTFEVNDIEKAHDQVKKAGLEPTGIKEHAWEARVFYLHDPEGNRIEFWSRKPVG